RSVPRFSPSQHSPAPARYWPGHCRCGGYSADPFWIAERGKGSTLIQARGRVGVDAVVEYHTAGQRLSSRFSYWERFNAKSKYAVGDQVEILYNPRNPSRFVLDSWGWLDRLHRDYNFIRLCALLRDRPTKSRSLIDLKNRDDKNHSDPAWPCRRHQAGAVSWARAATTHRARRGGGCGASAARR